MNRPSKKSQAGKPNYSQISFKDELLRRFCPIATKFEPHTLDKCWIVEIKPLPVLLLLFFFKDFQHKITVQASPSHDRRRSLLSSGSSPPTSPPLLPRLRAIQRMILIHTNHPFKKKKNFDSKCSTATFIFSSVTCGGGWARSAGEDEVERRGSRKKGRTRVCGPQREHSADARWPHTSRSSLIKHIKISRTMLMLTWLPTAWGPPPRAAASAPAAPPTCGAPPDTVPLCRECPASWSLVSAAQSHFSIHDRHASVKIC